MATKRTKVGSTDLKAVRQLMKRVGAHGVDPDRAHELVLSFIDHYLAQMQIKVRKGLHYSGTFTDPRAGKTGQIRARVHVVDRDSSGNLWVCEILDRSAKEIGIDFVALNDSQLSELPDLEYIPAWSPLEPESESELRRYCPDCDGVWWGDPAGEEPCDCPF